MRISRYWRHTKEELDYIYHNIELDEEEISDVYAELYNETIDSYGYYSYILVEILLQGCLEMAGNNISFKPYILSEYKTGKELVYSLSLKIEEETNRLKIYLLRNGKRCFECYLREIETYIIAYVKIKAFEKKHKEVKND